MYKYCPEHLITNTRKQTKKWKTFAKYFLIKAFCNWYILFPLQKYNGQLPCHEIQLKVHGNSAGRHTVTKTWLFKNVKLSINMYVQNNLLHQLEAQLKQDLLSVVCWDTGSTVVVRPWWHSHTSKCHNFPFSFQTFKFDLNFQIFYLINLLHFIFGVGCTTIYNSIFKSIPGGPLWKINKNIKIYVWQKKIVYILYEIQGVSP